MSQTHRSDDGSSARTALGEPFQALDLLPDAALVVGLDGAVLHANPMAARLLHTKAHCLIGSHAPTTVRLADETGEDWWTQTRPMEADPRLLPRIPERELELTCLDDSVRPVMLTGARAPVTEAGPGCLVLCLRHAERRHRLDAARSELVATVSHELRSPLTAVKGFSKTLLAKWDRFSDDQKRQMLATINEDADRVTRLLTELLDVSRIDAGRLQLRRHMITLRTVVDRVCDRVLPGSDRGPVEVSVDQDLATLYADEDKVGQVLTNLVENALKYGDGRIRIHAVQNPSHVLVTVSDEGGRIDPAHLRHIFTKFFRRTGERHSGTGLGLYISKGIVEAHGGRIWAESSPDEGTAFHFTLPLGGLEPGRAPAPGPMAR